MRSRNATLGFALLLAGNPTQSVDPFIGTGAHGHTYPGATLPFGMVQLSPDTRLEGWDACSGYHDSDRTLYGFSHTHLSGTGVADYGDILLLPLTGEVHPDSSYRSRFRKESERAEPGWYAVHLQDTGIDVELSATLRTGLHRYRFPKGVPASVVVDLRHRDVLRSASLRRVGDNEIEGQRRSSAWARDQHVYFVAHFSRSIRAVAFADSTVAVLDLGTGGEPLEVQVSLSAVSVDGARRNLEAEASNFEAARQAARRAWKRALSRIVVEGGSERERTIFYTALYHSLLAPNLFSDVDGAYRGMDGKIHQAAGRDQYTVFSLWDTFRATHPLFTLLEPERTRDFIETFLSHHEQGGRLPVWELAANETDCMIGYHAVSVIADAWLKGIRGYDGNRALDAMLHSSNLDHFGLQAYKRQGFIGGRDAAESVSRTLEYAYDDWCIARMAEALGRADVARHYDARSQAWRHLFDPTTRFMRPRVNQRWLTPFDPRRVDFNFTEANAWQYSFFVPHDIESLIEAHGGDKAFVARLDSLFAAPATTTGREQADITGLIGQYAHGNEPSHHVAWLYHYAGRPDLSALRVRDILDTLYDDTPAGLCGNEDCGQMSSWYVLAALGIYPVCPGSSEYVIGVPLFERATLQLGDKRFTIRRHGARGVIQSARLNGRPLQRSYLTHDGIVEGGELVLQVGDTPGDFGRAAVHRPHSRVQGAAVLAAPFVVGDADRFRDSLAVQLQCADAGARVHYALAPQPEDWHEATGPLVLRETTTLQLVAKQHDRRSPVVNATFHRLRQDWRLELSHPPAPQYSAGGAEALVDGIRGPDDWRTGDWHGYQDTDFVAVVDLGQVRPVRAAGAGFLQDVPSWIWMPRELTVALSRDGKDFVEVARMKPDVADDLYGVVRRDLVASFAARDARFVRILARNYGVIPAWHPGHGGNAWIFTDEILIE